MRHPRGSARHPLTRPVEARGAHARVLVACAAAAALACEAPPGPFGAGPVPTPVPFLPEAVPGTSSHYGITFSADGTEAYFTRQDGGPRGRPEILTSRFSDGRWTPAEVVPFSSGGEESPFLTPDGDRLFFSSRREMPDPGSARGNSNIWFVERSPGGGWGEPRPVEGEVNKPRGEEEDAPPHSEGGPVLLAGGELLYWTTESHEWGSDIYVAEQLEGRFVNPRPLLLNTTGAESHGAVSPDGRWLVFQAYREYDAIGEQDLYLAERTAVGWTEPRLLSEPVNSPASDGYPSFSPDGRFFFFASDRSAPGGPWTIYYVDSSSLQAPGSD